MALFTVFLVSAKISSIQTILMFKCSKRTSIVGIAIPSLRNPHKKRQPLLKIQVKY